MADMTVDDDASVLEVGNDTASLDGDSKNRKQQFRFSADTDVLLAKEVLAHNPFDAKFGEVGPTWDRIAVAIGAVVDGRRCRERVKLLTKSRKQRVAKLLAASGIEELVTELDQLLDEILSLEEASVAVLAERKKERTEASEKSEQAGEEIRQQAMTTMKPREKRRSLDTSSMLSFLQTRHEAESDTKKQKIELEGRRIELEERRLALAEKRAELESQERVAMIQLLAGMAAKMNDSK